MARAPKKKFINLALQGGGAHGAVSWGVLDRLLSDDRIEIARISGCSAGAVNAVALAYGLHIGGKDKSRVVLEELWRKVSCTGEIYKPKVPSGIPAAEFVQAFLNTANFHLFDIATKAFSPYQFNPLDINPLRDILDEVIDFKSLRCCKFTEVFIGATNVKTGKVKVFPTSEVSSDVVSASACLPYLFKAVEINGHHYWDGGFMGNPVLFPLFGEPRTSDIVIVHVNPIERDEVPQTAPDISNRLNEITFNSSLLRELRAIEFVQRLLDEDCLKDDFKDRYRHVLIHSVRSDQALVDQDVSSKFRTDWPFLNSLKEKGFAIADAWLAENFDQIGEKSSVDLQSMFDSKNS